MTVFVLIREDQNQHGFVDTSIAGLYGDLERARLQEQADRARAVAAGLIVDDDDSPDGEWQVSWKIEEHVVA